MQINICMITIPNKLWQIWIGPKPAPSQWMNTWPKHHPNWDYKIMDTRTYSLEDAKIHMERDRKYIEECCYAGADNDKSGTGEKVAKESGKKYYMSPIVGNDINDDHIQLGLFIQWYMGICSRLE